MTEEEAIFGRGTEKGGNGVQQGEIRKMRSDRRWGALRGDTGSNLHLSVFRHTFDVLKDRG